MLGVILEQKEHKLDVILDRRTDVTNVCTR